MWKDIVLNKNDSGLYAWGLQMYQSKWGGSSHKLHQIAQALAAIPYPTVGQGLLAVKLLRDNENSDGQFQAERQILLTGLLARTQKAIAANPGDAQAHYDQGYALSMAGHKTEAVTEYKNVALLRPASAQSYFDIAQEYDQRERSGPAISAFRQGLKLDPTSEVAHYGLGWDLKNQGKLALAEAEMRQAVQLNPSLITAAAELALLLDEQDRYPESLTAGRHALQINPQDNGAMDTMDDDYLHLKLWTTSIQMSRSALQVDANDALAHENLGEAFLGQGLREDAHTERSKFLTLDRGAVAQTARQMLAKYP